MIKPPTSHQGNLHDEIASLGHWFHNLHLPDGTQTAPYHPLGDFPAYKWKHLAKHIPTDLAGWTALDIGCNAGFYTFELAQRGARVTAIDSNGQYLAQAQWAAKQYGLSDRVTFRLMQVYDLAKYAESYDLVLFMGVFYHLRYPTLALDIIAQRVKRMMVFQTLTMPGREVYEHSDGLGIDYREAMQEPGWPKMAFSEHTFAGDPTSWWAPNHACVEAILRAAGMKVTAALGHELYICAPNPDRPSDVATWNAHEYLSAIGATRNGDTH